jgi:excisionase family DNA binding protein
MADERLPRLGRAPKDVARALGVNVKTIYQAVERGELPAVRLGTRVIIPQAAIDRMLASPPAGEKPAA